MHHSIDICYGIAEKLKDPERVTQIMNEQSQGEWSNFSFVRGFAGIACFYALMNSIFEKEGWDKIAHQYLKQATKTLESAPYRSASLFFGLGGISFSTLLCSQGEERYSKLLSKLDGLYIHEVRKSFLKLSDYYLDPHVPIPSQYYDLANGLSGIIVYLLQRDDLRELTTECVDCLIKVLSSPKVFDSVPYFAWATPPSSEHSFEIDEPYKKGFYRLEIPYGLPGVVATLSLAARKGIKAKGLLEFIKKASSWIQAQQTLSHGVPHWDRMVPLEGRRGEVSDITERFGNSWLMGALGVAKSLYTASIALNDRDLEAYSETIFLADLRRSLQQLKKSDSSFCFGKAGLLCLAYQMGCDTEKPVYFKIAKEIEEELSLNFNPSHSFGFQSIAFEETGAPRWIDNPTVYHGAAGVGLSLLQAQGRSKVHWEHVFLIS